MGTMATLAPTIDFFIVEVIGHDGMVHHLGPFRKRAHAERWIEQHTQEPFVATQHSVAEAVTPSSPLV
jgi:hypothetical protein